MISMDTVRIIYNRGALKRGTPETLYTLLMLTRNKNQLGPLIKYADIPEELKYIFPKWMNQKRREVRAYYDIAVFTFEMDRDLVLTFLEENLPGFVKEIVPVRNETNIQRTFEPTDAQLVVAPRRRRKRNSSSTPPDSSRG